MTGTRRCGEPANHTANADHHLLTRDWAVHAACRNHDPEMWFTSDPPHRPGPKPRNTRTDRARQICAGCPVQAECLAYALAHGEEHGIWGGLDPKQRKQLAPLPPKRPGQPPWFGCGTPAGHRRHLRNGERACRSCVQAATLYRQIRKETAK